MGQWPWRGWLPSEVVAVELVAIRPEGLVAMEGGSGLVAMGVLNMGLVAVSGESAAMDVELVAIKNVTLRVVAIWFPGHGSWVGGLREVDEPQGFHPLFPSAPR